MALTETENLIMVLAERNRLQTTVSILEHERDNLAEMLDNLMIQLKDHGTCPSCSDCPSFDDEVDSILRLLPEVNLWWVKHQSKKAEMREEQRIAALGKLTRDDAVALGIEEDWDDLAHQRHMEE